MLVATLMRATSSLGDFFGNSSLYIQACRGVWALGLDTGPSSGCCSSRAAPGEHQPGGHFAA